MISALLRSAASYERLQIEGRFEPFAPPNLLQTTAAAFLNIVSLPASDQPSALVILLPSSISAIVAPSGANVRSTSTKLVSADEEDWPVSMLQSVHAVAVGQESRWIPLSKLKSHSGAAPSRKQQRAEVHVDENMYV